MTGSSALCTVWGFPVLYASPLTWSQACVLTHSQLGAGHSLASAVGLTRLKSRPWLAEPHHLLLSTWPFFHLHTHTHRPSPAPAWLSLASRPPRL